MKACRYILVLMVVLASLPIQADKWQGRENTMKVQDRAELLGVNQSVVRQWNEELLFLGDIHPVFRDNFFSQ